MSRLRAARSGVRAKRQKHSRAAPRSRAARLSLLLALCHLLELEPLLLHHIAQEFAALAEAHDVDRRLRRQPRQRAVAAAPSSGHSHRSPRSRLVAAQHVRARPEPPSSSDASQPRLAAVRPSFPTLSQRRRSDPSSSPSRSSSTDSSLHLSERAHQALGLERRLAPSPTRSDAEESPAQRKPFVNLSDEDGSHSETDRGQAPADSSPDSDDDSHSSSSDEGLLMSSRPQLGRAQTWTHGSSWSQALGPPRAHSSSDSDDESDDDDALVMAPVRRAFTAPGPSSSSAAAAAAAAALSGRRGRPPPLKKDAFVPRPRDGPKSPSTTRQDGEPAYGRISSPVNEETKVRRRRSFLLSLQLAQSLTRLLFSPRRRSTAATRSCVLVPFSRLCLRSHL